MRHKLYINTKTDIIKVIGLIDNNTLDRLFIIDSVDGGFILSKLFVSPFII